MRLLSPCWGAGDLGHREARALLLGREAGWGGGADGPFSWVDGQWPVAQINPYWEMADVGVLHSDPLPSVSLQSWKLFTLFLFWN